MRCTQGIKKRDFHNCTRAVNRARSLGQLHILSSQARCWRPRTEVTGPENADGDIEEGVHLLQPFSGRSDIRLPRYNVLSSQPNICPPLEAVPMTVTSKRLQCTGASASRAWLLIGVQSTHSGRRRRDAIRASWMKWTDRNSSTMVCFLVGGLASSAELTAFRAEAAETHDMLSLPSVEDGRCFLAIDKMHAWWRVAAADFINRADSRITHVARVDDDVRRNSAFGINGM